MPKIPAPKISRKIRETECSNCVNREWCRYYRVIFLVRLGFDDDYFWHTACEFPCVYYYEQLPVVIGYCDKSCYTYCRKYNCPYCPKSSNNIGRCEKHDVEYDTLNYFRGNGMCCKCLKEFKDKLEKENVIVDKIYMAKRR